MLSYDVDFFLFGIHGLVLQLVIYVSYCETNFNMFLYMQFHV